jgi:precorrin-2/cobalt-factor-2 C20-methyltransferase
MQMSLIALQQGGNRQVTGKLFSVGIGPGDPELLTLERPKDFWKTCPVVAIPQGDNDVLTAKGIVSQVVDLSHKKNC